MALEPVTHITDLVSSNPVATDNVSQGDDHLRNIKKALTTDFAAISGPVTATHTELNIVSGKTLSSSDDVIDNFPAGTKMLFQQTSAPTGWTKDTSSDNRALRVVTGSAASGGSVNFSTIFGSGKVTGSHALTISEAPDHKHDSPFGGGSGGIGIDSANPNGTGATISYDRFISDTVAAGSVSADRTGTPVDSSNGSAHSHTLGFDIKYLDVIIATKN